MSARESVSGVVDLALGGGVLFDLWWSVLPGPWSALPDETFDERTQTWSGTPSYLTVADLEVPPPHSVKARGLSTCAAAFKFPVHLCGEAGVAAVGVFPELKRQCRRHHSVIVVALWCNVPA